MERPACFSGGRAKELVRELRESFRTGRTVEYEWRVLQLDALARMVKEREAEIMGALQSDLSKPHMESYLQEISLVQAACRFTLNNLKQWMKPEKVPTSLTSFPSTSHIVPEPLGVVLVISTWNFPVLLSLEPVIGAIAAGNTVVLKPSEVSPATSSLFAKIIPKYLDTSCVRVVEGSTAETTALLEQKWDKIFYTGSAKIGRIVMAAASKHLTPVVLELGGKCPIVVDSSTNLEVTTKRIAVGKWGSNNGQACVAPDYIITTKAFAPKFIDAMKITLEKFYGKDPLESKDISRIVNSNHFARVVRLLDEDLVADKVVCGGKRDEKQLYIAPTLLLDVSQDSLIMNEEIFGPLLPIITVDNIEESFDIIKSKPRPLAAYLFTKDKNLQEKFVNTVSAGGILINDTTLQLANPNLPFGGVGESGMGCYHGKFSFDAFTHTKAVMVRNFCGEGEARYPPYTTKKQKILRGVINGNILSLIIAVFGWSSLYE